jgi:hypothetical protein
VIFPSQQVNRQLRSIRERDRSSFFSFLWKCYTPLYLFSKEKTKIFRVENGWGGKREARDETWVGGAPNGSHTQHVHKMQTRVMMKDRQRENGGRSKLWQDALYVFAWFVFVFFAFLRHYVLFVERK